MIQIAGYSSSMVHRETSVDSDVVFPSFSNKFYACTFWNKKVRRGYFCIKKSEENPFWGPQAEDNVDIWDEMCDSLKVLT